MNCSCNAASYGEGIGYWSKREIKAAKNHVCYECGGVIKKGELFSYHTVFERGGVDNFKLCMSCDSITENFFSNGWMFGFVIDDLKDYLHYSWREDLPSSCISKLEPKARDMVCDYLQEYQEE